MSQPTWSRKSLRRLWVAGLTVSVGVVGVRSVLRAEPAAATAPVTFAKDVAPIFQDKCEVCHRADGMAPMSLTTFEEVRPWVRSIRTKVAERQMPPWYV